MRRMRLFCASSGESRRIHDVGNTGEFGDLLHDDLQEIDVEIIALALNHAGQAL